MELSRRLRAVAGLVTPGNRLADVGTDHGYIPIYLIKEKKIPSAIAMDVNRGPLQRAVVHISEEGLTEKIETRLSDGLKELKPGEVDAAVIAGMGGALTIRILEEGREVAEKMKELILQPQSEIARVRYWLTENGFSIEEEDIVLEDGKYYPMMRVACHTGKMTRQISEHEALRDIDALYGPILLKKKSSCLKEYLQWEQGIKENVLIQLSNASGEAALARRQEVEQALQKNKKAQEELR